MKKVGCQQTHSANVHVVELGDIDKVIPDCDGLITNIPNVEIYIKTADCVPITIEDKLNNVVGVIHAGWRGTQKEIVKKSIKKIIRSFKSDPKNIQITIGPSIDKDNFLVRSYVYNLFADEYSKYFEMISEDQWKFDLVGVNVEQLLRVGVLKKNIIYSNISTYLDNNYPSFRRDGKTEGFVTKIMLK